MAKKPYTASLSPTKGRSAWALIFRHPIRQDRATGRVGRRVRRGLGTSDEAVAQRLCDQLNELLADPKLHDASGRAEAERRFDPLVVEIFFDGVTPEPVDYVAIRDAAIPLPGIDQEYRRVLFLGTTGVGKTTLVRQLIGTDPGRERFPSTSTAKTTVHDMEIVLDDGPWRAVATFVGADEVREYLNECISAAVLAAWRGAPDHEILRRLLNHVDQRFRFNYVLGNGPATDGGDFADDDDGLDDDDEQDQLGLPGGAAALDLDATKEVLERAVEEVRAIASRHGTRLRTELDASDENDERVLDELFEEELDNLLRDDDKAHRLADELLDEIEKRFDLLTSGHVSRTKQGWLVSWTWETEDRSAFIRETSLFSSNYAPFFGRLLTPLVNGVRVAGPFAPTWHESQPKLVLLDGEGLGHTPRSTASVSTTVSRLIQSADAVVLVDNATQPMQAAPIAAMRELIRTGAVRKLILAFTHFDEVKGDNLPTAQARAQHVLAAAENVLASIGEDLGPFAEKGLRTRIEGARVFLGGIQDTLSTGRKSDVRTVKQLKRMLVAVDEVVQRLEPGEVRPVYDRMNLVLAVRSAAEHFLDTWFPILGLTSKPGISKEHWARIKALSRRLAEGWADEYNHLKPVADLRRELIDGLYVFLQNPVQWDGAEPSDDDKLETFNGIADEIGRRMIGLATKRVWNDRASDWRSAYDKRGRGSTFVRAQIIGEDIYRHAAPIPAEVPSPDRNEFLRQVVAEVEHSMKQIGARLR